jgi:hypothetical protein
VPDEQVNRMMAALMSSLPAEASAESSSSRLGWKTRRLARVAAQLAGVSNERLERVYEQVLAVPPSGEHSLHGSSDLNNDGVPLQLCLVSNSKGSDVRLIGDPCAFLGGGEARYQCSTEALRRVLADNGLESFSRLSEQARLTVLPSTPEERRRYTSGFIWIAASLLKPGIGFYLEAGPLGQAAGWEAAIELLRKLSPAPELALGLIDGLKDKTIVASIGLEGTTQANSRIKIYFRLAGQMALSDLGVELFNAQEMNRFLNIAMADFGLDLDGLVLCLGLSASDGQLADVKIDLCGHCLTYSQERWVEVVDRCLSEFSLQPIPVRQALEGGDCSVAFIGFGMEREGQPRLNLYLQASEREEPPLLDEITAALEDGLAYLCRIQDTDGKWTDFQLPVGPSDQWVTAYVGQALAQAGKRLSHEKALTAARQSADWLLRHQNYPAGWGYNTRTGPDADSTSICLALLRELNLEIRREDQQFLRQYWHPEGGFSTYEGPDAWGRPHWDVTPLGYLGLAEIEQHELREPFLRALAEHRLPGGLWRSYWWRLPFYSTWTTLEALEKLGIPESAPLDAADAEASIVIDNSFDLACLIGIETLRGAPFEQSGRHLRTLLGWQQPDGSWPGHANLRVTDDACHAPWDSPAGNYFRDEASTITTATVVRVLIRYLSSALMSVAA